MAVVRFLKYVYITKLILRIANTEIVRNAYIGLFIFVIDSKSKKEAMHRPHKEEKLFIVIFIVKIQYVCYSL